MNEIIQQDNQNSNVAIFSPQSLMSLQSFAQAMSSGVATLPAHLQGNPSDCMAIAMQAIQWNMNPYAVAQKTFVVGGVLGYEAQLVNAVISTRGPLIGRIEYDWFGPWDKIIGKFQIKVSDKDKSKGKEYRVPGWRLADEEGIGIKVWATLRGENKPRELTLLLAQARTRNSTLWADDPRQQLAYLAVKRWARLYCPEVILGVYTPDELEERQEREINPMPAAGHVDIRTMDESPTVIVADDVQTYDGVEQWVNDFRQRIEDAESTEVTTDLRQEVELKKSAIGIDLFTELKGKVVQRHHHLTAVTRIKKMINELPKPDQPEAAEKFMAVENTLNAVKVHLGNLYDGYCTTLADMKPEYIGA
ncbi:RecT family recombinase [Enterobacter kobei]|uniref:RecT family recombinase n=1 Tax=Enterobacter kobei TaxID=208224 RepID=UPI002A7FAAAD|nr:RecT family recombinase [Enterobacter kobei]